ncbi:hypothetical protein C1Y35_24780 [Pseudomonas sp. GW456-L14]|nr:hypothetical protein C1Y35_24780 [Pseudomonas sp. GW456-L14]PMY52979.1 hypothetical protein C1Y34_20575 [Pseudomonas sp. GW456-L12]
MRNRKKGCPFGIETLLGCTFQGAQARKVHGGVSVNETSCDIHDVIKAASDLVSVGCDIGMTHFLDGFTRLQFGSIISDYANEIIRAVDNEVISAWQGLQEIRAEYAELSSTALFYAQNGVGVLAGGMQIEAGIAITGASGGIGIVPGALLVGHGANNIAEGVANIYNGPNMLGAQGPMRRVYQTLFRDTYKGDKAYYSTDLFLSGYGMFRSVRAPGSVQLFRYDPVSNEKAYQQAGKLALFFEGLVDAITLNSMVKEERPMLGDK